MEKTSVVDMYIERKAIFWLLREWGILLSDRSGAWPLSWGGEGGWLGPVRYWGSQRL